MTVGVTRNRRISSGLGIFTGKGRRLRILQREHAQDLFRFGPIIHRMRARCHRKPGNRHQIRGVVVDRQRNPIIRARFFAF